jgi:class 3 adenylate cyclase
MTLCPPAVHHTIVVTDIENFTDPARTNLDQLAARRGLYKVIKQAFSRSGIDWNAYTVEDRGDGVFILVPSDVPKIRLVTTMLDRLGTGLSRYNTTCTNQARIRLRMALHAGEVYFDNHGVVGRAVNHTFRMVDEPLFKASHANSSGLLSLVVSEWFYDEVIRHYPSAQPSSYSRVALGLMRQR